MSAAANEQFRGLPIEIFESIITLIVDSPKCRTEQQRRDLCACSLVCTAFVPLCQKILFEELCVEPGSLRINLAEIFQQNQSLSQYPRRLLYISNQLSHTSNGSVDTPNVSILLQLPRVQSLSIYAMWEQHPVHDHDKTIRARHFLKTYANSGGLTHLFLGLVNLIPIHDILALSSLTHLHIEGGGISSKSEPASAASSSLKMLYLDEVEGFSWTSLRRAAQLKVLCFSYYRHDWEGILYYPNTFNIFPMLKNLSIEFEFRPVVNYYPHYLASTNNILDNVTGLEEITFTVTSWEMDDHLTCEDVLQLHLRECVYNSRKTLKRINLYIRILGNIILIKPIVYDVLSSLQSDNILEEIEIIVFKEDSQYMPKCRYYYDAFSPTLPLWRKLDELLDNIRFPCLNTFRVGIHCHDTNKAYPPGGFIDQEQVERYRREVRDAFVRLMSDGGIDFKERVCVHDYNFHFKFPDVYTLDSVYM